MSSNDKSYPIIDLHCDLLHYLVNAKDASHCDLLHYLVNAKDASPNNTEDVGCAIPYLQAGNVKLQVMAISSVDSPPDISLSGGQVEWLNLLLSDYNNIFCSVKNSAEANLSISSDKIGLTASIENASVLVNETESIEIGLDRLNQILQVSGKILYISLTHHLENRFGGGNMTQIGIKDDGCFLLNFLSGRKIAVDLSHTSDRLAWDIIEHIDTHGLDIPIIASHSNFREISDHPRNLPDDLAKIIIERKGLIGMNFVRAFLHPSDKISLQKNIEYGLALGGEDVICLGADYFYTKDNPDQSRQPFYLEGMEHAGRYQEILNSMSTAIDEKTLEKISHGNVLKYLEKIW